MSYLMRHTNRKNSKVTALSVVFSISVALMLAGCAEPDAARSSGVVSGTAMQGISGGNLRPDELSIEPDSRALAPVINAPVTEKSNVLASGETYLDMDWDELIPAGFTFDPIMEAIDLDSYSIMDLDDNDPEAQRLYRDLQALLADVPAEPALQGVKGRLPGFAVPLDFDGDRVYSFLLVPYFGACIHTPPPPANQMVFVEIAEGFRLPSLYDPVIIEGAFDVTRYDDDLGTAGYRMQADRVMLY